MVRDWVRSGAEELDSCYIGYMHRDGCLPAGSGRWLYDIDYGICANALPKWVWDLVVKIFLRGYVEDAFGWMHLHRASRRCQCSLQLLSTAPKPTMSHNHRCHALPLSNLATRPNEPWTNPSLRIHTLLPDRLLVDFNSQTRTLH